MPPPPTTPVPVYDVRNQNNTGPANNDENVRPSVSTRKLHFNLVYGAAPNIPFPGFNVTVPLKQFRRTDTPSRAEIAFEWDILCGDFYDRICARMDLDPKEAVLGYKFETDTKNSIVRLPSNDPTTFDTMIEKVRSRIARARTRAVVLEIHDLVCTALFALLATY